MASERRLYTGRFLPAIWQKLQEIKEELGLEGEMRTLEHAIIIAHSKLLPGYAQSSKVKRDPYDPDVSAKKKVEREIAEKEARKEEVQKLGYDICSRLDGDIIDPGNGFKVCRYTMYDLSTPNYVTIGESEVPLELLNESNVANQYRTDLDVKGDIKELILEVLSNN